MGSTLYLACPVAKDSSVLSSMRGWSFAASCLAVFRRRGARVHPVRFRRCQRSSASSASSGAWQAPREQCRPPPGPVFGGGGEEDVRAVGGHGDAVPELAANIVLRLVLADGLSH